MIECPNCETKNEPIHRYCGKCGAEIQRPCPNCKSLMEITRSFCGKCGASLEIAPEPEWDEEDRRLIARMKGVLCALLVTFTFVLVMISGILPDIEYVLPVLAIMILPALAPMLANTGIALKPSGMRTALTKKALFTQAILEMIDFPGRVMRSDPPWTWFVLILVTVGLFVSVVLDPSSFQIESALHLPWVAFSICLLIAFVVALVYWLRHLNPGTFLKLLISAALRSISGVLIGSLVAIVIVGLERVLINIVLGFDLFDDMDIGEFILFIGLLGGSLMPAFAWLSESFDRDLLLVKYRDELEVEKAS